MCNCGLKIFDLLVIFVLLFFVLRGFKRGFVGGLLGLLGYLGCFIAVGYLCMPVVLWFSNLCSGLGKEFVFNVIFVSMVLTTLSLWCLLKVIIGWLMSINGLGVFGNFLGAFFYIFAGIFFISMMIPCVTVIKSEKLHSYVLSSKSANYTVSFADKVLDGIDLVVEKISKRKFKRVEFRSLVGLNSTSGTNNKSSFGNVDIKKMTDEIQKNTQKALGNFNNK